MSFARRRRRSAGYMMVDTVIGLVIAGMLGLILIVAIMKASRAGDRVEDGAAATRLAQRALVAVQQGKPPEVGTEATVQVMPVTVEGQRWVEVTVNYHGRSATLVGLALAGGGQ
jgi:hypothetical protein